jgi:predicted pyridoxine 5'-phosphate oxidase superfamily flavin-nucleotide-binding protein
MSPTPAPDSRGFHEGERAVQHAAGAGAAASRLEAMLDPAHLSPAVGRFLETQTFVALTARDDEGRLWASPLVGPAGFLEVTGTSRVRVHAVPSSDGDPLHGLQPDQPVGTIAIDHARRRRFRLNGHLTSVTEGSLEIDVGEAFGNCPQYLTPRSLALVHDAAPAVPSVAARVSAHLGEDDRALAGHADMFVLGTSHPLRGNDASHRGGPRGFVRVSADTLWWPDYPGNNMFTSLGNLATDPSAALAFFDFDRGRTLHLSGQARLRRTDENAPGDDAGTGRGVVFETIAVAHSGLALRTTVATATSNAPSA